MIVLPESIKFVITDFDGIVTDNCVYIGANGEMSRKLNFKDVMGFSILRKNGYRMGIILSVITYQKKSLSISVMISMIMTH